MQNADYNSAFLNSQWLAIISNVFNKKLHLLRLQSQGLDCIVPLYIDNENQYFSIGSIGSGGPNHLVNSNIEFDQIIFAIQDYINIDLFRCTTVPMQKGLKSQFKMTRSDTRILDLSDGSTKIFNGKFNGRIRNAIRKSYKSGVEVHPAAIQDLNTVHELIIPTQQAVKADYRTPKQLIEQLFRSGNMSKIYKATFENKIIAVCICIYSKDEMSYYLNGWNRSFSKLYANQAIIYQMIQDAQEQQINLFNFGISHYESLDKSKAQWGAEKFFIYNISNI